MSAPSLPRSGAALILRRRRSRTATLLWFVQVSTLAAAGLISAGPTYVKLLAVVALGAYARACWPGVTPTVVCSGAGRWAVPELGLCELSLDPRTTYTRRWAQLQLIDTAGRRHRQRIWADEVAPQDWRRLQLLLREPEPSQRP